MFQPRFCGCFPAETRGGVQTRRRVLGGCTMHSPEGVSAPRLSTEAPFRERRTEEKQTVRAYSVT